MTKREVVEAWFERVWSQEDSQAIHEMFAGSATAKGLGARPIAGPKEFEVFQKALLKLLQDLSITIDRAFERDDWICVFCTLTAKKRGTQKAISMPGCAAVRIQNDKIMEGYNHWEFMSLFEQLDLLPTDSFATCLQGKVPTT